MKIAVIAHLEHPISMPFAGGLEKHTKLLCDGLVARGHEVVLYADPLSEIEGEIAKICERYENFHYYHLRHHNLEFYQTYLSKHYTYLEFMHDILNDRSIDIVHNNSLHYLPVTFGSMLSVPMVSVLHTPPLKELSLAYKHESSRESHKHRVLAVSNFLKNQWLESVPDAHVVHNGIFIPPSPEVDPKNEKSAFWYGRIVAEKGLTDAVRACSFADVPLRIAGPISDADYFAREIAPLLENEGAMYIGHLNDDDLKKELKKSSVVIVTPKWEEPFGLVAVEAMASGVPVVAYRRGGLPELITSEVGVLVNPEDLEGMARGIREVIGLNSQRIWKHVQRNFSIEAMISKYEEHYEELIRFGKTGLLHPPRREWTYSEGLGTGTLPQ